LEIKSKLDEALFNLSAQLEDIQKEKENLKTDLKSYQDADTEITKSIMNMKERISSLEVLIFCFDIRMIW